MALKRVFNLPSEISQVRPSSSSSKFQSPSTVLPKTWSGCHRNTLILVPICLSQGFYSCIKHHDQEASWGGKGLFSLHLHFHIAVHHQRKSELELKQGRKQELMHRPWRDVPYWLPSPGLLSLLSYRTQDYQPRDGTTNNGPSTLNH